VAVGARGPQQRRGSEVVASWGSASAAVGARGRRAGERFVGEQGELNGVACPGLRASKLAACDAGYAG